MIEEQLTEQIIGACIDVHRQPGLELLDTTSEHCLCHELMLRDVGVRRQVELPVIYKAVRVDGGYSVDIIVEGRVILELKTVDEMPPIYEAQLLTCLRLWGLRVDLLINFNVNLLTDDTIRRVL